MADTEQVPSAEEQQQHVDAGQGAADQGAPEAPAEPQAEVESAAAAEPEAAAAEHAGGEQPQAPVDASAAAQQAAAIAARLAAAHGVQSEYPVSSGAEHAEGNHLKRAREDDPTGEDDGGPDKKRASAGLLSEDGGADPTPGGPMETLDIPANMVGKLIGRGGETIRNLQLSSDTRIQVDHSGGGDIKRVTISGTSSEAVAKAKREIQDIISDEDTTETMECPAGIVGRIIGRGGETIRALQSASQAHITVDQNFPEGQPRKIVINGRPEACRRAVTMVTELINGEPGSAQAIIQRVCQECGIGATHVVYCPKGMVGRIIGRSGDTIKQIQRQTGATIQIDQGGDPCKVTIAGQPSSADQAKRMIDDIVAGLDPFHPGFPPGNVGRPPHGGFGGPPPFGAPFGGPPFGGFPPYGGPPPPFGGYPPFGAPFGAPFGGPAGGFGGFGGPDPYAAQGYGAGGGFGGPGGYGAGPAAGGAAAPGGGAGGGGSSGLWQELHDDQGRPYYYNTQTMVTQWEKPADF